MCAGTDQLAAVEFMYASPRDYLALKGDTLELQCIFSGKYVYTTHTQSLNTMYLAKLSIHVVYST
jgi:hypothetical protein